MQSKAYHKEFSHEWYLANKDRHRTVNQEWIANNKEKHRIYQRDWARANREKKGRNWELLKDFGITYDQYNAIFNEQGGRCAICNRHQSEFTRRLAVDHNHNTKKVRGLLCFDCNTSLGKFNDDPQILHKAIEYLNGR